MTQAKSKGWCVFCLLAVTCFGAAAHAFVVGCTGPAARQVDVPLHDQAFLSAPPVLAQGLVVRLSELDVDVLHRQVWADKAGNAYIFWERRLPHLDREFWDAEENLVRSLGIGPYLVGINREGKLSKVFDMSPARLWRAVSGHDGHIRLVRFGPGPRPKKTDYLGDPQPPTVVDLYRIGTDLWSDDKLKLVKEATWEFPIPPARNVCSPSFHEDTILEMLGQGPDYLVVVQYGQVLFQPLGIWCGHFWQGFQRYFALEVRSQKPGPILNVAPWGYYDLSALSADSDEKGHAVCVFSRYEHGQGDNTQYTNLISLWDGFTWHPMHVDLRPSLPESERKRACYFRCPALLQSNRISVFVGERLQYCFQGTVHWPGSGKPPEITWHGVTELSGPEDHFAGAVKMGDMIVALYDGPQGVYCISGNGSGWSLPTPLAGSNKRPPAHCAGVASSGSRCHIIMFSADGAFEYTYLFPVSQNVTQYSEPLPIVKTKKG